MILTLDSKRRLTVPAGLAPAKPGDHFKAQFDPPQAVSWLLDSDVLGQPAKKAGNPRVIAWLEKHQDQCKRGKQRTALQKWLTDLIAAMHGRILGFNVSVARTPSTGP